MHIFFSFFFLLKKTHHDFILPFQTEISVIVIPDSPWLEGIYPCLLEPKLYYVLITTPRRSMNQKCF